MLGRKPVRFVTIRVVESWSGLPMGAGMVMKDEDMTKKDVMETKKTDLGTK